MTCFTSLSSDTVRLDRTKLWRITLSSYNPVVRSSTYFVWKPGVFPAKSLVLCSISCRVFRVSEKIMSLAFPQWQRLLAFSRWQMSLVFLQWQMSLVFCSNKCHLHFRGDKQQWQASMLKHVLWFVYSCWWDSLPGVFRACVLMLAGIACCVKFRRRSLFRRQFAFDFAHVRHMLVASLCPLLNDLFGPWRNPGLPVEIFPRSCVTAKQRHRSFALKRARFTDIRPRGNFFEGVDSESFWKGGQRIQTTSNCPSAQARKRRPVLCLFILFMFKNQNIRPIIGHLLFSVSSSPVVTKGLWWAKPPKKFKCETL